jgi:hypothetical protein
MPRLRPIRTLTLDTAAAPGMAAFVSAASGLVRAGPHLYVIADDLQHLARFPASHAGPGSLVRLFHGTVPADDKARKKVKRDLESLVVLAPFAGYPHGALLALGSGSRPRRRMGAVVALDAHGRVASKAARVDLAALYAPIEREFGELNVEGAFVCGGYLALLQRGGQGEPRNARIRVKLPHLLQAIVSRRPLPASALHDIVDYPLPAIDGIPLGFTDGAALRGGGFAFTAVAENTQDAYADGACAGSAIGIIGANDKLRSLWRLAPPLKVEGIAVEETRTSLRIQAVTDADDPKVPARLLAVTIDRDRV